MIKIGFDVMSGDTGYKQALNACLSFLNKYEDVTLLLIGNEKLIKDYLKTKSEYKKFKDKFEYLNTEEIILPSDSILDIRRKPNASLNLIFKLIKENQVDGCLSAGSSAAMIANAYINLNLLKKDLKPFFAPIFKNYLGEPTLVADAGANIDTTANNLYQYAILSNAFIKTLGISDPKIALLNNGVEENKGTSLQKDTFSILTNDKTLNFVGNVEANDIITKNVHIILTDGYSGNILLKSYEGMAKLLFSELKKEILKSSKAKIGALFLKDVFKNLKNTFDFSDQGGALILGVDKIVVKAHGSSDSIALQHSLKITKEAIDNNLIEIMKEQLKNGK